MNDRTGPLSFILVLTNLVLVLFWATTAHAQGEVVASGADKLLDRGVLGILVVIEGAVIWMLFREIRNQHAAQLAMAKVAAEVQQSWIEKLTTLVTRVGDHMDRQDVEAKERDRDRSGR